MDLLVSSLLVLGEAPPISLGQFGPESPRLYLAGYAARAPNRSS